MIDIDAVLHESLNRLAVPADPGGVAEAIQARVDSGDPGSPGPSGGSGGGPGPFGWLPLVGFAVLAIAGGLALGLSGALGHPVSPAAASAISSVTVDRATLSSCPGGPSVAFARPGERVLAIARSADGSYLGIRNPDNTVDTVWIATHEVAVDSGAKPIDSLPVDSCALPTAKAVAAPRVGKPRHTTAPTSPTKPATPDKTAPTLGTPSANRGTSSDPVCINEPDDPSREKATITVTASDNRGVTSVAISWLGPGSASGSGTMTRSGSTWHYVYDPVSMTNFGTAKFSLQARDAAGNKSAVKTIDIVQEGCVD
jgi:hypothetical protein